MKIELKVLIMDYGIPVICVFCFIMLIIIWYQQHKERKKELEK